MQDEPKLMLELLRIAVEAVDFCRATEILFDKDTSVFKIADSRIEIAWAPGGKPDEYWRIREYYEVADYRKGGFRPQITILSYAKKGEEIAVAKAGVLKALELLIDADFDEHAGASA